jgi:hypothetical protein
MASFQCKDCGETFDSGAEFSSHVRVCPKNPVTTNPPPPSEEEEVRDEAI